MEWTTLAGTGLGAGVGSTLLADPVRWRRETGARDRRERRDLYVTCLTKYRLAYEDTHAAARETVLICAPEGMTAVLEDVYASLRELPEVFAAGDPALDTPEFQEHRLKHAQGGMGGAGGDAGALQRGT